MRRGLAKIVTAARAGLPILCADTCSVLDIIRDPTRDTARGHESRAAVSLVQSIEAGRLVGLLADQVVLELGENRPLVKAEATDALDALTKRLARMDEVAAAFGAEGASSLGHFKDHLERADAVVGRWIAATDRAPQTPMISHRSVQRMLQGRAPAKKGKDSTKDCLVIETYLDVIRRVRGAGVATAIGFVSSNTRDYAGEVRSALRADLAEEFSVLKVDYYPNLSAAKHGLAL